MRAVLAEQKPKTNVYFIQTKNGDVDLGVVKWYAPWRQYTFFPVDNTIFSRGCMSDINTFIENLMNERKASSH